MYENNWHERAVNYLRKHTRAIWDLIERFVESFRDQEISDEENLVAFENYESKILSVFSF